jgi:predicted NBD/HSP70 family sugar kinase
MSADPPTGATSSLRRTHRGLTLRHLLVDGETSRTEIADRLGLSQMAASRIVRELIDAGLVEEAGLTNRGAGPGRYATSLRLRDRGVYAAGITFSAYSTEVAIVGATGRVVAHKIVALDGCNDGGTALGVLADALVDLIDARSIPRARLVGVGVVLSAHLDAARHRVVNASYLGLEPFDVVEPVALRTGLPAIAENIANALALAEASVGVAKDVEDIVVVRSATSIGATILHQGRIIRGQSNRAGQIGHLRHRATKLTCSCGRNDCLNCSASGWAVLVRQGIAEGKIYNPTHVEHYASAIEEMVGGIDRSATPGAPGAKLSRDLRSAGGALADALLKIDQMIDPEAIVLAGSMPRIPDYVAGIGRHLNKLGSIGQTIRNKIRIGEIRAVRAAALLVLLEKVYSPHLDLAALHDEPPTDDRLRMPVGGR